MSTWNALLRALDSRRAGWCVLLLCLLMLPACAGDTLLVSKPTGVPLANNMSIYPSLSADGNIVAFQSSATNLVAGDTNGKTDIFVRNMTDNTVVRASLTTTGSQGNGDSTEARLSGDGTKVVFTSLASNFWGSDGNGTADVFLRDLQTNTLELISVTPGGTAGNNQSIAPSISGDGRYVTFMSTATDLVAGTDPVNWNIYVRDRQTGTTILISREQNGTVAGGLYPMISANGGYVAFASGNNNLVPGDTNNRLDVFRYTLATGVMERVSVSSLGIAGNNASQGAAISADGQVVAFESAATNLVPGDTNTATDVFVRNLTTGTTTCASVSSLGIGGNPMPGYTGAGLHPALSADGRMTVFESWAENLTPDDSNNAPDVFLHDNQLGTTTKVSVSSTGIQGNSDCALSAGRGVDISADGRWVVFNAYASTLVLGDTNNTWDIFLHDGGLPAALGSQPDLKVRWAADEDYLGDGIYNDLDNQTRQYAVEIGAGVTFYVQLENDGADTDTFTLSGTAGDDNWEVSYSADGLDITDSVVQGTATIELQSGWSYRYLLHVAPGAGVTPGATYPVQVTATSTANTALTDTIGATALAVAPNQPPNPVATANGVANLVVEQTGATGTAVTLDASASTDADGTIAGYGWDLDGDGTDDATDAVVTPTFARGGPYTVTLTVTDDDGATATATVTVTVVDTTKPVITAPADVTAELTDLAGTPVAIGTATATDVNAVTITSDAPATFPLGPTVVTWTAKDAANNTATATQTVTVVDTTKPTITAPADVTAELTDLAGTAVVIGTATATDVNTVTVTSDAPATFPLGATLVTWTARDAANNTATATQTVTVVDTTNPAITAPADVTAELADLAGTAVNIGTATATDLNTVTITSDAPATFPLGPTVVTWTAKDASNNTATATQTVTVVDTTKPLITAPADVSAELTDAAGTPVEIGTATATDVNTVTITSDAPATFKYGATTVTWTATDAAGNAATATQTVTVVDTTKPMIAAPADVTADEFQPVVLGKPTVTDANSVTVSHDAPKVFPVGTTVVTWTVRDAAGNTATATQQVTINAVLVKIYQPDLVLLSATNAPLGDGLYGSITGQIQTDNATWNTVTNYTLVLQNDGNVPEQFVLSGSRNSSAYYTVWCAYRGTDLMPQLGAGWTTPPVAPGESLVLSVMIQTKMPPERQDLSVNFQVRSLTDAGKVDALRIILQRRALTSVTLTAAPAGKQALGRQVALRVVPDGGGQVVYSYSVTYTPAGITTPVYTLLADQTAATSLTYLPPVLGIYTFTVVATDKAAAQVNGGTKVKVTLGGYCVYSPADTTPPVLTVPPNTTIEAKSPGGQAVNIGTAKATDDSGLPVTITNDAPKVFPLGVTVVTWTATDAAGNVTTATQRVSVLDTKIPQLTVPPDIAVVQAGVDGTAINLGTATAVDAIDPSVTITNDAPALFPVGKTVVTWTASDDSGNTATGRQTVSVVPQPQLNTQPDVQIGMVYPSSNTPYKIFQTVGKGLFNQTGLNQTVTQTCTPEKSVVFGVIVTNAGNVDQRFLLSMEDVAATYWTVTCYDERGPLTLPRQTNLLTPGAEQVIFVQMTPRTGAYRLNGQITITATSTITMTQMRKDVVGAVSACLPNALTSVKLAAQPIAPKPVGTLVTLTAIPVGGEMVEYAFSVKYYEGNKTVFVTLQDFSPSATCPWTLKGDHCVFTVEAREKNAKQSVSASLAYPYLVPLRGVSLSMVPSQNIRMRNTVRLTAIAAGGDPATIQYRFEVNGKVVRDYSPNPSCSWTPTTVGTASITVYARDGNITVSAAAQVYVGKAQK